MTVRLHKASGRLRCVLPALLLIVPLSLVAACSGAVDQGAIQSAGGSLHGIDVTGPPGTAPRVRIAAPLSIERTRADTLVAGTGPKLYLDRTFVLQLSVFDARTGDKAFSTYDAGQVPLAVTGGVPALFPALTQALVGVAQGGRVVVATTADDGYGDVGEPRYGIKPGDALVLVADVVATPPAKVLDAPVGTPRATRPGLPRVTTQDVAGVPHPLVTFGRGLRKPTGLVVVPLVEGTGPPVSSPGLVTLDHLGQVWGARVPFDDTFAKEPRTYPVGVRGMIPGWERALSGIRRGSRLLIVVPPGLAYGTAGRPPAVPGDATLVYVVDVLGVS